MRSASGRSAWTTVTQSTPSSASRRTPASTAPFSPRPGSHTTRAPWERAQSATSGSSQTTATGSGAAAPMTRAAIVCTRARRSGSASALQSRCLAAANDLTGTSAAAGPSGPRPAEKARAGGGGALHRASVGGGGADASPPSARARSGGARSVDPWAGRSASSAQDRGGQRWPRSSPAGPDAPVGALARAGCRDRASGATNRYLAGIALSDSLSVTSDLTEATAGASMVLVAVPSHGFRAVLEQLAPSVGPGVALVSLTKGIEAQTNRRMSQIVAEVLPDNPVGVLTGPNLAREIAEGQPAASVVALADQALAEQAQAALHGSSYRVYTSADVVGCEIAGAVKNVIAVAAGMSDGLGFGENTRAALITRGLAELARPSVALGGDALTFGGLAGVGDLVATCTSPKSRNRSVGSCHRSGRSLADVLSCMRMVAEGVKTARPLVAWPAATGRDADRRAGGRHRGGHPHAGEAIPALMLRRPSRSSTGWTGAHRPVAGPGHPRSAMSASSGPGRTRPGRRGVAGRRPGPHPGLPGGAPGPGGRHRAGRDRGRPRPPGRDRLLVPGEPLHPERGGTDHGDARGPDRRFWRALDSPTSPPTTRSSPISTSRPSASSQTMVDLGAADVDTALQLARVDRLLDGPDRRGRGGPGGARDVGRSGAGRAEHRGGRPIRPAGRPAAAGHDPPPRVRLASPRPGVVRRAMLLRSRHDPGAAPILWWASPTWSASRCSASSCPRRSWPRVVRRFEDVAHDT